MKLLSILITTTLLLIACTPTTSTTKNHEVSRIKLLRSMTYTHRNLLELELNGETQQEQSRRQLLLHSHCDLIDRKIINSQQTKQHCQRPTDQRIQACIANFHQCIGNCPDFKKTCQRCEKKASLCLKKLNENQLAIQSNSK